MIPVDIVKAAREALDDAENYASPEAAVTCIAEAIQAAILAERERCAMVAHHHLITNWGGPRIEFQPGEIIAKAIMSGK